MVEFNQIFSIPPEILNFDQRGRLEERKSGYVRMSCPGGWGFWVAEDQVMYPSID